MRLFGPKRSESPETPVVPPRPSSAPVPGRHESADPQSSITVIGPGLVAHGDLDGDVDLQIQGTVVGDVRGRSVTVRQGAQIHGAVTAGRVRVSGLVNGPIHAATLDVAAPGRVLGDVDCRTEVIVAGRLDGDIHAPTVSVAEGGSVAGSTHAERMVVRGNLDGRIEAFAVQLGKAAHVKGAVLHNSLNIELGGYIDGPRPWRPPGYFGRG